MNLTVHIKLFYITYYFRSSFSAKNTYDIKALSSWWPSWKHVWAIRQLVDLTLYNEDRWESTTGSHLNCTGHTGSSSVRRTWRCWTSGKTRDFQSNPTCQKNKTKIMGQALLHYLKLIQTEQFSLYS